MSTATPDAAEPDPQTVTVVQTKAVWTFPDITALQAAEPGQPEVTP